MNHLLNSDEELNSFHNFFHTWIINAIDFERVIDEEQNGILEMDTESDEEYVHQGAVSFRVPPANLRNFPSLTVPDAVKDSLTSSMTTTSITINERIYDANLIADYLVSSRDLRDPILGTKLTKDHISVIENAVSGTLNESLKTVCERSPLPKSTSTSRAKYFTDMIDTLGVQLLTMCELESLTSLQEFEKDYFAVYKTMVKCFCGLLKANPLKACSSALSLYAVFNEAWTTTAAESDVCVHEPRAIGPVFTSISNLTKEVQTCVRKCTFTESAVFLSSLRPAPVVSNSGNDSVWNRLLRGLASEDPGSQLQDLGQLF